MPITTEPVPTTTWEVVSIDTLARSATVRFENPYYSGAHVIEVKQPLLDAEGAPTDEVETVMVDQDPNPHAIKTVRVPTTATGQIDQDAFKARLAEQASGVRHRMDAHRE